MGQKREGTVSRTPWLETERAEVMVRVEVGDQAEARAAAGENTGDLGQENGGVRDDCVWLRGEEVEERGGSTVRIGGRDAHFRGEGGRRKEEERIERESV